MVSRLGPAGAWLFAWTWVALVNQVALARLARPRTRALERALHHAFDLGQLAALALLCAGVAGAWVRWGSKRRGAATAALAMASIAVGLIVLPDDFARFAERKDLPWAPWPMAAAVALAVPAAFLAGMLARRRWLRPFGPVVAVAAAVANHLVLEADYSGLHLALVWTAVAFAGSAMTGAVVPEVLVRRPPRAAAVVAEAAVALLAAATLVVWPPSRVLVEIGKTDGTVLMPFLARLRGPDDSVAAIDPTRTPKRWLEPDRPPIPASKPSLLPEDPLVLLVTLDAVRADVLADPNMRRRLPHLAGLSDRGVHFRTARSPGSTTRNSLASIFAGKYNAQLNWKRTRKKGRNLLHDDTPRLPDLLRAGGLRAVHLTPYHALGQKTRTLGKFDEEQLLVSNTKGQRFALAAQTLDAALEVLDRETPPLFLFMHWMDAHDPYDSAGTEGTKRERWFEEVVALDAQLGRLLAALEERKLADRTLLVVTADHGEALGDHGIPHHGTRLYESLVRVPLIIHYPGVQPRVVDDPVTLMDLGPTVLDLVGLPTPGHFVGQSLVPYLRGESPELDRPLIGDTGKVRSIIYGRYKVIDDQIKKAVEIYDLVDDPWEEDNLVGTLDEEEERAMLGELRGYFRITSTSAAEDAPDD